MCHRCHRCPALHANRDEAGASEISWRNRSLSDESSRRKQAQAGTSTRRQPAGNPPRDGLHAKRGAKRERTAREGLRRHASPSLLPSQHHSASAWFRESFTHRATTISAHDALAAERKRCVVMEASWQHGSRQALFGMGANGGDGGRGRRGQGGGRAVSGLVLLR